MCKEKIKQLEERLSIMEFKFELLTELRRIGTQLIQSGITRHQYMQLLDLMDEVTSEIENEEEISRSNFEQRIYAIRGEAGDHDFCKLLAQCFMEDMKRCIPIYMVICQSRTSNLKTPYYSEMDFTVFSYL